MLVFTPGARGRKARVAWIAAALVGLPIAAGGLVALWYFHRPTPPPFSSRPLFKGIAYERDVRFTPRPLVTTIVTIDLDAPGLSFLVTPLAPDSGGVARGETVSDFLVRQRAQLAINGDFFLPWWSDGPTDYYPHAGWPTDVLGLAVSGSDVYGWRVMPYASLLFHEDGGVTIEEGRGVGTPLPRAKMVLSGKQIVVDQGAITPVCAASEAARAKHPRTAAALDRTGKKLILFAADGRQPGYSEGASLAELAQIIVDHGGFRALNLDGGGSTTVAIEDGRGGARVLNRAFHTRIPGRERPVANHLAVFAERIDGEAPALW
ncbi:MAG: phosphodiester glycosidase family protein [Polyangiaceae bacterium]